MVIVCKFNVHLESIASILIKDFFPNEKQRRICETLNVADLTWFCFMFKKNYILKDITKYLTSWYLFKSDYYYFRMKDKNSLLSSTFFEGPCCSCDEKEMHPHSLSIVRSNVKLTSDEKHFILYRHVIDKCNSFFEYERYNYLVIYSPSRLREICVNKIHDYIHDYPNKIDVKLLPKPLFREISENIPLLKLSFEKRMQMRAQFYDPTVPIHTLFFERDISFSKEFVAWFRNDPIVCEYFRKTMPINLNLFTFFFSHEKNNFRICLNCAKWYFEIGKMKEYVKRYFTPQFDFWCLQSSSSWCNRCNRVPLFQVLDLKTFEYTFTYGFIETFI